MHSMRRQLTSCCSHFQVLLVVLAVVQVSAHFTIAGALQLIIVLAASPRLPHALRTQWLLPLLMLTECLSCKKALIWSRPLHPAHHCPRCFPSASSDLAHASITVTTPDEPSAWDTIDAQSPDAVYAHYTLDKCCIRP